MYISSEPAPYVSGYLRAPPRRLEQACRDRHAARRLGEPDCAACPLRPICNPRAWRGESAGTGRR